MKKRLLLLSFISFTMCQQIIAYDFEVNGIFYTVLSFEDFTVAVDGFDDSLSGIIDIQPSITYNNKIFSVVSIKSGKGNGIIESVSIPTSIFKIEVGAFYNSSIKWIEIPDNVMEIGGSAFQNCTNLSWVRMSPNVSTLNPYLFSGCTNLTKIDWHPIGEYGSIRGGVFYDCTSLKSIRIPSGVNISGGHDGRYLTIFKNCTSLDSLIIEDGEGVLKTTYTDVTGGDDYGEFKGCKINYLYLGRALNGNSKYSSEIPNLRSVEHLVIGDKVTEIPTWFPNQPYQVAAIQLKTLVIGASLKNVNHGGNTALEYIKLKSATPPEAVGFTNYNYINTILYVPKGTKSIYESANIWKNFWNIQEYDVEGGGIEVKKCAKPTIYYSKGKLSFVCETEDAICHASITDTDIKTYNGNEIQLGVTYTVNVYATKAGYENSDVATATLCWIDIEPKTEGITDGMAQMTAKAVMVKAEGGQLTIEGAEDNTNISVYSIDGIQMGATTSRNGVASIMTAIPKDSVAIVKIGNKSVKVMMK